MAINNTDNFLRVCNLVYSGKQYLIKWVSVVDCWSMIHFQVIVGPNGTMVAMPSLMSPQQNVAPPSGCYSIFLTQLSTNFLWWRWWWRLREVIDCSLAWIEVYFYFKNFFVTCWVIFVLLMVYKFWGMATPDDLQSTPSVSPPVNNSDASEPCVSDDSTLGTQVPLFHSCNYGRGKMLLL